MPDAAHLASFALAALLLAVIPGPGMLYVLARTLAGGTRAGSRSVAGTAIGGAFHVLAAVAGLSALIVASATAFELLRLAGAAYLVWLGIQTLRSAGTPPDLAARHEDDPLRQGILTEALNPKTALFFLTFLPQFVQPERGAIVPQLLALGLAAVALNSAADAAVVVFFGRLRRLLEQSPRWWRRQRIGSGLVLVGLGGAAAAAGHRP